MVRKCFTDIICRIKEAVDRKKAKVKVELRQISVVYNTLQAYLEEDNEDDERLIDLMKGVKRKEKRQENAEREEQDESTDPKSQQYPLQSQRRTQQPSGAMEIEQPEIVSGTRNDNNNSQEPEDLLPAIDEDELFSD